MKNNAGSKATMSSSVGRRGTAGSLFRMSQAVILITALIMTNLQSIFQVKESRIRLEAVRTSTLPGAGQDQQTQPSTSNHTSGSTSTLQLNEVPRQWSIEVKNNDSVPIPPTKGEEQNSNPKTVVKSKEDLPEVVVTTSNTTRTNLPVPLAPTSEPTVAPIKSRIFLGISFSGGTDQLRNFHRVTYLNYFSHHHTSTPNRTCTLREFEELLQTTNDHSHLFNAELSETCRLVYTFLLEGTERWDWRRIKRVFDRNPDVMILNTETYPLPPSSSLIPSWTRWYQFAMDQQYQWAQQRQQSNQTSAAVDMSYFDFVAHTDFSVQLQPEEFWNDNPMLNTKPGHRSNIFAQGDEFTLLSTDLVKNVVVPNIKKNLTAADDAQNVTTNDWLTHILGNDMAPQPLIGVTRYPNIHEKYSWLKLLKMWDAYKDPKLEQSGGYSNPQEEKKIRSSQAYDYLRSTNHTIPRLLFGIFTMDSPKDRLRRDTIRQTYLSFYNESNTPHRICALSDLTRGILTPEQGAQCQLAYAFVMGSNPNGTKSLLEPSPSNPMVVDESNLPPHLLNETDIVHLNIEENMEDGKTPTWIRFATDFVYEQFYFDYVGKLDSDTLLYPDQFLDGVLLQRCPPFPNNVRVFGGHPLFIPYETRMTGPLYMSGQMYWMSPDLGRFVTSEEFKERRQAVDSHVEDWAMGNFVHSHPWPIRRVMLKSKSEGQDHPVKEPDEMMVKWKKYVTSKGGKRG